MLDILLIYIYIYRYINISLFLNISFNISFFSSYLFSYDIIVNLIVFIFFFLLTRCQINVGCLFNIFVHIYVFISRYIFCIMHLTFNIFLFQIEREKESPEKRICRWVLIIFVHLIRVFLLKQPARDSFHGPRHLQLVLYIILHHSSLHMFWGFQT